MPQARYHYRSSMKPLLVFLAFSIFILLLGNILFFVKADFSSFISAEERDVYIPLGASVSEVASILHEEEVISSPFIFKMYFRFSGSHRQIQAGEYSLTPGMSLKKIMDKLQEGVVHAQGQQVTIPEGYTVKETALRFEENNLIDNKETLLELSKNYYNSSFEFLKNVPEEVDYTLEGYLYPNTYEFSENTSPEEIINIMLGRFASVLNENLKSKVEKSELSLHEVVTLASIVQKEAKVNEEKPLIAAVFINRILSDDMQYLQSCATVQYALDETTPVLSYEDLRVESPYNTYINQGLPPGPIAAPGKEALKAVLEPAEVDYLYFVSKEDGSGTHYFSETLEGHNHYKRIVAEEKEKR